MTTAPIKAADGGVEGKKMSETRPAHALNDKLVTLRHGGKAVSRYRSALGSTELLGGHGQHGYVWTVMSDKALVHFGGQLGQMTVAVADLVEVK